MSPIIDFISALCDINDWIDVEEVIKKLAENKWAMTRVGSSRNHATIPRR
jgi:hypothetical protein